MRTGLLIVLLLSAQVAAGQTGALQPADDQWHLVAKGQLASISVSRTLYEKEGEKNFLIRIRVANLADKPIGLDLGDFQKVVYPNQVGFEQEKLRGVVDERHTIHRPLTDEQKTMLVAGFKAGTLVAIPARGSTDYFRKFDAGDSLALARKNDGKYFFVSLDGEQLLTDGVSVEQVFCAWEWGRTKGVPGTDTELFIPTPVRWEKVPPEGRVVSDERKPPARKHDDPYLSVPILRNLKWPGQQERRTEFCLCTPEELKRMWAADGGASADIPHVDFEKEWVLGFFAGKKITGHRVEICGAVRWAYKGCATDGPFENFLSLLYRETGPAAGQGGDGPCFPCDVVVCTKPLLVFEGLHCKSNFVDADSPYGKILLRLAWHSPDPNHPLAQHRPEKLEIRPLEWPAKNAKAGTYVFRSKEEMEVVFREGGGIPDGLPKVDFDKEQVLAVFLGRCEGGALQLQIGAVILNQRPTRLPADIQMPLAPAELQTEMVVFTGTMEHKIAPGVPAYPASVVAVRKEAVPVNFIGEGVGYEEDRALRWDLDSIIKVWSNQAQPQEKQQ